MTFRKRRNLAGFGLTRCARCYSNFPRGADTCEECSAFEEMEVDDEGNDRNVRSRLGEVRCFNEEDEAVDENLGVELVGEVNTGGWDETGGGDCYKEVTLEEARVLDEAIRRQRILLETAYCEGNEDDRCVGAFTRSPSVLH